MARPTSACIRRGEVPAGGWPVLMGQLSMFVLICTSCHYEAEVVNDGRLPEHCPRCDGWAFTGEIAPA